MTPPVPGPTEGLNAAVAAQLRAEIAAANLTDKALAELADVKYTSLRRWLGKEKGNERHIDVAVLGEIADALGLDPAEIVRRARERLTSNVVVLDEHRSDRDAESDSDASAPARSVRAVAKRRKKRGEDEDEPESP